MDEQNKGINVYLRNEEEKHDEEIIISLPSVIRKLKKYFLPWFLTAIIIGGLVTGLFIFTSTTSAAPVRALVSFTYNGIEKGKNPDGTDFDAEFLKNPKVIEAALKACGMDLTLSETVRQGISVDGQVPQDAYDRLTVYKSLYENAESGQLSAAEKMLDVTWNPTQFGVKFDYKEVGFKRNDAVNLLNAMLEAYRDFFFEQYGYNEALGQSLATINYKDYDYPEAVDVISTALTQLKRYVNSLANDDTARFRSTDTGYTFADLRESINTIQNIDLSKLDSYISFYNVTKDKERTKMYYEFRIEALEREQTSLESQLKSVEESIKTYEKDEIYVFGGTSDVNLQSTTSSEQYDRMVRQKISLTDDLGVNQERLDYYEERLSKLRKAVLAGDEQVKSVEKDLERIEKKAKEMVQIVNDTADDYYRNYSLSGAYNILVPASSDVASTVVGGIKNAVLPVAGLEVLLFVVYLGWAFIEALKQDYLKRKQEKAAAKAIANAAAETANAAEQTADQQ